MRHIIGKRVCCHVLPCVAECCSVLQCVAVCCSALQCVAQTLARVRMTHVDESCYARMDESCHTHTEDERWGAGVETQTNVRGEIGGWGRIPFNEPYAPSLSIIYDGA